ncbi:MAG: Fe2+-dependent dioxygenase [Betaproteobacteria bacterium]
MLLHVPEVLDADRLQRIRALLAEAAWVDGRITAGTQSAQAKNNQQLPEDAEAARAAGAIVLDGLKTSALFFTAALPKKIVPPLFNRYAEATNAFGSHVDNAVRTLRTTGAHIRTDIAITLFLCDPGDYEGGELIVEDTFGAQSVKLPAGDLILYPASSVHRVQPVTRGARLASFFWVESMVRDTAQRRMLFDMDMAILALRRDLGDAPPVVQLTSCYHNLLRMWADL